MTEKQSPKDNPAVKASNNISKNADSFLRTVIKNIPDLVWLKDENGVYIDCNNEFELFFGAKREEIVGKTDYDFVDRSLADFFRANDLSAMSNNAPSINEEEIVYANSKKTVLLETIKTPIKDDNGAIIGVLGIGREITKRKAKEKSLKSRLEAITNPDFDLTEIEFEDIFNLPEIQDLQDQFSEATKVASIITQPDGTPITKPSNFCYLCEHIIRKTSKGCENCFKSDSIIGGFNADGPTIQPCISGGLWDAGAAITVGGRHIANWLIGQVRNETQSEDKILEYAEIIGADREKVKEAFYQVPSMSYSQFESISKMLFSVAGQLSKVAYQNFLQARHIEERKRFEEQTLAINEELLQKTKALKKTNKKLNKAVKKAEQSDRLKSAFLSNINHEIRTPLNAILGFTTFLNDSGTTREELRDFAQIITRNGERLLALMNSIIHVSEIEAGLVSPSYRKTNIVQLLSECVEAQRLSLHERNKKNIKLSLLEPSSDILVETDPILIRQTVENLLDNAVKFTASGEIEVGCELKNEQLCCWIKDSGIGIDPQKHAAIFDRFRKEAPEEETLYEGLGIGLSICKSSVRLLKGNIWVESKEGEGSTFYFSTPIS